MFNFLATSTRLLRAWQGPPPLRSTPSLGLEKRFLLLIMVARVVADGQDGATFPVLSVCACTARLKVLLCQMCPTLTRRAPSVVFSLRLHLGGAQARSNRRSPSAAVLGALANHSPHHSPCRHTKTTGFFCIPLTSRAVLLSPPVNVVRCDMTMRCELVKQHASSHQPPHTSKSSSSWSTGPKALSPLLKSE